MAKQLTGTVLSNKMNKAVVVEIARFVPHPKYRKIMIRTTKIKAHCEVPGVLVGDKVNIAEVKPFSREIHFQVMEIIGGAKTKPQEVKAEKRAEKVTGAIKPARGKKVTVRRRSKK